VLRILHVFAFERAYTKSSLNVAVGNHGSVCLWNEGMSGISDDGKSIKKHAVGASDFTSRTEVAPSDAMKVGLEQVGSGEVVNVYLYWLTSCLHETI
jgi:hypothetical protein